jgi:hypothetical protein
MLLVSPTGEAADALAAAQPLFSRNMSTELKGNITEFWNRVWTMVETLEPRAPLNCPLIRRGKKRKSVCKQRVKNTANVAALLVKFERDMQAQKLGASEKPTHHLQTSAANIFYNFTDPERGMKKPYTMQEASNNLITYLCSSTDNLLPLSERISQWGSTRFVVDIDKVNQTRVRSLFWHCAHLHLLHS